MRSIARTALSAATLLALAACSASDLAAPADENSLVAESARGSTINTAPTAWISSPAQDASYKAGTAITFSGTASDKESGSLTGAALVWKSDRDGQFGTGKTLVYSNLSVGTHTISLTATDPQGLSYTHNRTITITGLPNQAPSASISAPSDGTSVVQNTAVTLTGAGTDAEDGTLADSLLVWSSDKDGPLGAGTSLVRSNLSVGTHVITLSVKDSKGATATSQRSLTVTAAIVSQNTAPEGWINTPTSGASFVQGTAVAFSGAATDAEDGTLSGASIVWTSSINGQIGTGTSFSKSNLSVGTHTITMTSTDSKGASFSHNRSITITAAPIITNQPPVASFNVSCLLLVCSFNASTSTDDTGITQYSWNFGNGTSTTLTVPLTNYTYLIAGTVSVSLTVRDAAGLTSSVTKSVSMLSGTTTTTTTTASTGSMEPTGFTKLAENPMDCVSGCSGWYFSGGATNLVTDASAPRSGGNVVQQNFTSALPGGSSPATIGTGLPQRQTLYMSMWMKMSSNWVGHPTGVNKVMHFWTKGANTVVMIVRGTGSGTLTAAFNLQGLAGAYSWMDGSTQVTSTEVNLMPNLGAACEVKRGQWHKYETVLTNNTPGVADGRIEYWLDGVKCGDFKNIMIVGAGQNNKWEEVMWSPTWGGMGGTITDTFSAEMDHIYISGK